MDFPWDKGILHPLSEARMDTERQTYLRKYNKKYFSPSQSAYWNLAVKEGPSLTRGG
jgi:hypothetical protein